MSLEGISVCIHLVGFFFTFCSILHLLLSFEVLAFLVVGRVCYDANIHLHLPVPPSSSITQDCLQFICPSQGGHPASHSISKDHQPLHLSQLATPDPFPATNTFTFTSLTHLKCTHVKRGSVNKMKKATRPPSMNPSTRFSSLHLDK